MDVAGWPLDAQVLLGRFVSYTTAQLHVGVRPSKSHSGLYPEGTNASRNSAFMRHERDHRDNRLRRQRLRLPVIMTLYEFAGYELFAYTGHCIKLNHASQTHEVDVSG